MPFAFKYFIFISSLSMCAWRAQAADTCELVWVAAEWRHAFRDYTDPKLLLPVVDARFEETTHHDPDSLSLTRTFRLALVAPHDPFEVGQPEILATVWYIPDGAVYIEILDKWEGFGAEYGYRLLIAKVLSHLPGTTSIALMLEDVDHELLRELLARGVPDRDALLQTPAARALESFGFVRLGPQSKIVLEGPHNGAYYPPSGFTATLQLEKESPGPD